MKSILLLFVTVGCAYSDFTWGYDVVTFGSKANFGTALPDDMRFMNSPGDTDIIELPYKYFNYESYFFSLVDLRIAYQFVAPKGITGSMGIFCGFSYLELEDGAPSTEDASNLSTIVERNYLGGVDSNSAIRKMGCALVYYKPAVKDVPLGLFMSINTPRLADLISLSVRTQIHYSRIVAQNGWDTYDHLSAKENRTLISFFPIELSISLVFKYDEKLDVALFTPSLIIPYAFITVKNKEYPVAIKSRYGFSVNFFNITGKF
jgi:hypothetical protein